MPDNRKERNKKEYELDVSFQDDNHEARGETKNQNEGHNVKRQSLGPNTERGKR